MPINYPFGLPLKHNLVEFIYYNGLVLPHEIDKIIGFWKEDEIIKATFSDENKY